MEFQRSCRRAFIGALPLLAMPAVLRAGPRRFRLGHVASADSVLQSAALGFDRALARASGGRLGLEIVPNGVLGNEAALIAALREGRLEMAVAFLGPLAALAREIALIEIPYLFADAALARSALDGKLGRHCADLVEAQGIHVAAWGELGLRHMTANRPIRGPADLRGLRLRVPMAEVLLQSFRAMGADAGTVPFGELPEALRSGRFEAQENPVNLILASRLYQVQSHLSLTGHMYAPLAICVASSVLRDLPAADRIALDEAAVAGAAASRAHAERLEHDGLQRLRRTGMVVIEDVDATALRAAAEAAHAALAEAFGADSIARIRKLAGA